MSHVLVIDQNKTPLDPIHPGRARRSTVQGFRTGDIAKAVIPIGTKSGTYIGRIAVREIGHFNITTSAGVVQGLNAKYFTAIHRTDGYSYQKGRAACGQVMVPPHA